MTYTCTSVSFGGRTSAAGADSKPSPVFRGRKRNGRPTSGRPTSDESRSFVETQTTGQDMEAFQQMFVASRTKFVAMAHAILRNKEDAEDAVQNAFLSGRSHLRSFEGRSALKTWFTRIVLNAALMIRRKRKSHWTSFLSESSSSDDTRWMQNVPASQPDPETVYAARETSQFIDELLGKMKPVLRQAFTMTYYDELSGPEACALLGISAGTFKARLFRAKRQLLNQAQRTLVAPMHSARRLFPDKDALQSLVARPSETSSLEAGLS